MAKRFTAHEIAMSIKETNSLKAKCVKLEHDSRKLNDQIASLRSLVKELADCSLLLKDEVCVGCPQKMSACEEHKCLLVKNTDKLVAKAREVANG